MITADDRAHFRAALGLARRAMGTTAPNPPVGCVLVNGGRVVGRGHTQPGGRPHAEAVALARAGTAARGATAYVTLEPCAHHGQTPPCAEALIAAGIARVVVGPEDPDSRVAGRGLAVLQAADVVVEVAPPDLIAAAAAIMAGFLTRVRLGRPAVTVKLAASLDGRLATQRGESHWITGPVARREGHLLRAEHDAVMVGARTAAADDPKLDVRVRGLDDRTPASVVVDGHLRLPLTSALVMAAAKRPVVILTRADADPRRRTAYEDCGVRVLPLPPDAHGMVDLGAGLRALAELGVDSVLVEGGGRLIATLIAEGLVDRIEWFEAGVLIGGDGVPAVAGLSVRSMDEAPRLKLLRRAAVGNDAVGRWTLETDPDTA